MSQILTSVRDGVKALYEQFFPRQRKAVDPKPWSTNLTDTVLDRYPTDEQIKRHQSGADDPPDPDITFF